MRSNYKKLGNYIQQVSIKNKELEVSNLLGVSITKEFIPSIANTVGTDMSKYKIVQKGQFAYGPVTSRNGDKISVALLEDDSAIVSTSYTVFEIIDKTKLLPEYLMMWFRREEFDRYARYMSHGSTREVFGWEEMCDVELPIPSIEKQREIVAEYYAITNRIKLNEQLNQKLEETAQAIYKEWFVDFEFPDENGKPYKSNGGEMVWCEELEKEIPKGWKVSKVGDEICYKKGYAFKSAEYSENGVGIVRVSNLTDKSVDISDCYYINEKNLTSKYEQHRLKTNDIIIATVGSWASNPASVVGKVVKVPVIANNFLLNQNAVCIRTKDYRIQEYLHQHLITKKYSEYVVSGAQGSANQASVTLNHLFEYKFIIPDSVIIDKACDTFSMVNKIINNFAQENSYLHGLKEILLSKMTTVEG
ncbi:predicted protein [Francisella tularensis subsp. novicida GA99-3548]|uniref:restriction endonuclease subunit S n=1 Tax=Francisella tularensis TaxID=263 RepID=UPI000158B28A|nr:restriction endonuclease subunit S [Francisella tularensis]AJI72408.1 type I restriction modification DNA specificity domain protein [Francisella tularensis subsp. novicida D9876]EDN37440.1 predicted protein [Francisella tularensis subsp. novicida GA99-3548]